jgi:hypothetical protein
MITITIYTDNAAFEDAGEEIETARILRELAESIAKGNKPAVVRDFNGNAVGTVGYGPQD